MTEECLKCIKWFHPKCLGIEETDEVKLNQMDVICHRCSGKEQPLEDEHAESDQEPCLGKRGSCASLDEEHISNLQETQNHQSKLDETRESSKQTENCQNEEIVQLQFGVLRSRDDGHISGEVDLKNDHSSKTGNGVSNGFSHQKSSDLGLESSQRLQNGVSQQVEDTNVTLELSILKKTPSIKQESSLIEGGKKSSTRSPLGLTPTKQPNITQYFPILAKSPVKTQAEQVGAALDRQEQS